MMYWRTRLKSRMLWRERKAQEALEIIKQGEIEENELSKRMGLNVRTLRRIVSSIRPQIDVVCGAERTYCMWTPRATID